LKEEWKIYMMSSSGAAIQYNPEENDPVLGTIKGNRRSDGKRKARDRDHHLQDFRILVRLHRICGRLPLARLDFILLQATLATILLLQAILGSILLLQVILASCIRQKVILGHRLRGCIPMHLLLVHGRLHPKASTHQSQHRQSQVQTNSRTKNPKNLRSLTNPLLVISMRLRLISTQRFQVQLLHQIPNLRSQWR
jgi:hypothetical protein